MNAPKLRFSGFQKEWEKRRLDTFLQRVSKPIEVIQDEQYFQIGIRSHGKGIFHKEPVSGKDLGNKRVFWVVPNALVVNIVFAWERAIAVTSESEQGLIASHRFPMYLPKDNLSNVKFLRSLFITDKGKSYLELASPGGAGRNKTLGQSNFSELKIDLPCVEEQTKIASFLSAVDEKISQLTQKHALLSQYKQGMMQKLFSQQIRFKADDGSEFGEWVGKNLSEIGEIITGKTPSTSDSKLWSGNILFVTPTDMKGNKYQTSTARTVSNNQSRLLPPNTIMFTCIASIGKMSLSVAPCITNQQINSVVVNKDNAEFIYYQLLNMVDYIKSTQANTTLPIINKTEFSKFLLKIPQHTEQTKITNLLSAIDQKIEVVAQQIEQAKVWKKGLLQQMFV